MLQHTFTGNYFFISEIDENLLIFKTILTFSVDECLGSFELFIYKETVVVLTLIGNPCIMTFMVCTPLMAYFTAKNITYVVGVLAVVAALFNTQ